MNSIALLVRRIRGARRGRRSCSLSREDEEALVALFDATDADDVAADLDAVERDADGLGIKAESRVRGL